ncbi:3-deoxy-D-manno-octulosonic acid transferase [Jejudonia soesokkakensis]|uniref:3-deoxy-D-manno-octulosonic acid transferase n=1 Tax=Jejudonia soesokkakensis TaxID=1323432 RepID=A0ABW2MNP1_9FLAO
MKTLYTIATYFAMPFLWAAQSFSAKLKLFVRGRSDTYSILRKKINEKDKTIWFHCASLGEYEQGVPVMEAFKKQFPGYKILVSFFSPSGYEQKKNSTLADVIVYLPLDTPANARKFIKLAKPKLALFIKYEFWPNYLFQLNKEHIPAVLISGLFREDQVFFQFYGKFMRKALQTFDHLFVQDKASEDLLTSIGFKNITISGDTRFDRVSHQIEQDNSLPFIADFLQNSLCIVCGSTWPEDEAVLLESMQKASENVKYIVAPHKLDASKIERFRNKLKVPSVLFSEKEGKKLDEYSVLIIDNIGLLTRIYSYADIAYVGGAMGSTGLHNILEAATFGVPVIIGKHHKEFPEAARLQSLAGLFSIASEEECTSIIDKLIEDSVFRSKTGMIAGHFVNKNTGATKIILNHISKLLN